MQACWRCCTRRRVASAGTISVSDERPEAAECVMHADAGTGMKQQQKLPDNRRQSYQVAAADTVIPACNSPQDGELADLGEAASQAARLRQAVQDASAARDSAQVLTPPKGATHDVA